MAVITIYFADSGAIVDVVRRERGIVLETAADLSSAVNLGKAVVTGAPLQVLATPIQKPLLIDAIQNDSRVNPADRARLIAVVQSADPSDIFDFSLAGNVLAGLAPQLVLALFSPAASIPAPVIVRYTDP